MASSAHPLPDGGNELPRLLDIPTLAEHLSVSVRHVRRLVAEDRIPYLKVGHFVRFDPDEVRRWLDRHRPPPGADPSTRRRAAG